jgi:hypothetical protein
MPHLHTPLVQLSEVTPQFWQMLAPIPHCSGPVLVTQFPLLQQPAHPAQPPPLHT